ncbi:MAG: methyltransferase domain-containing protein [Candidatus Hermodarchaeota archaeon]
MAVVYMRKLEEEPETYDSKFTTLTKGVNIKVQNWILNKINHSESILEIGCGTGVLAAKIAQKGNNVIAIDKNFQMINYAMKNYPSDLSGGTLLYQTSSFTDLAVPIHSQDVIVSKFMLSELRPLEQQIFLRNVWRMLKPNGRLILAAEFVPNGFWKLTFKIKRWRYKKKLRRLQIQSTYLIKWFFNYLKPIGFKVNIIKKWEHGSIQAIELQKINDNGTNEPGYYKPKIKRFKGFRSQLRIYRCIFTGQVDRVPIEPGIYQSGNPNEKSPIIVTANYEFTYVKVMRDLKGLDAWVLCVDSNGINVWCAARGNDFGNKQLLEAVEATGIKNITQKKTLLLPQLSAGGVAIPQLPKNSEKFPFRVRYGPVWSKQIPQFLEENPAQKPDRMKLAKFTLYHRIRAGLTHISFLFRKIFILPLIVLIFLLLFITWFNKLWWVGELALWIITANIIIALLFPISGFTRRFIFKGIFFGIFNMVFLGGISFLIHSNIYYVLWQLPFYFWITYFSTMSFSGYSMATSPREIQEEYPIFNLTNKILIVLSIVSLILGFLFLT